MLKAEIIDSRDSRWTETLSQARHDFYHLPGYPELEAASVQGAEACSIHVSAGTDQCLLPLLRVPTPPELGKGGFFDARSPYGYSGPIFTSDSAAFRIDALRAAIAKLSEQSVVSLFVRLHPLLNKDFEIPSDCGTVFAHGETVWLDLKLTDDPMWKLTRNNHRRGIKELQRSGATVEIDENWSAFADFHDCYTQTMTRVGASKFYFFSPEYFFELKRLLGDRLHLCVVRIDGKVACGGVFSTVNRISQYHLGGTADVFLDQYPSKLMFHFVRNWAREIGCQQMNLGGGMGGKADGLFLFKQGFSDWTLPFKTWRVVVNQAEFRQMIGTWEHRSGRATDSVWEFFPPYRKEI